MKLAEKVLSNLENNHINEASTSKLAKAIERALKIIAEKNSRAKDGSVLGDYASMAILAQELGPAGEDKQDVKTLYNMLYEIGDLR